MDQLHPNLRIASNLCRASAFLMLLAYFLSNITAIMPGMFMVAFTLVAAFLIRAGLKWFKWILLIWVLYNLQAFISLISEPWQGAKTTLALLVIIVLLQVIAVVFLFLPKKQEQVGDIDEEGEQSENVE